MWDVASGKVLFQQPDATDYHGGAGTVDISAGGKTAAWVTKQVVHVADFAVAKESAHPIEAREPILRVALSPDGNTVAGLSATTLTAWNTDTGAELASHAVTGLNARTALFSANGVSFCCRTGDAVVLFDARTWDAKGCASVPGAGGVAISDDAQRLAVSRDNGLLLFDATALPSDELAKLVPAPGGAVPPAVAGAAAPATLPGPPAAMPAGGAAFIGRWHHTAHFEETWTVAFEGGRWKVNVLYERAKKEAGSGHGENIEFKDGELTFTRVFDKAPAADQPDHVSTKFTVKGKSTELATDRGAGKFVMHALKRLD